MKKLNLLLVLLYLSTSTMFAQKNDNEIMVIPPSSGKVIIQQYKTNDVTDESEHPEVYYKPTNLNTQVYNPNISDVENQIKAGITVNIGRNFGANNMANSMPMDNSLAISNGGFIISTDNRAVDYYNEDGDTLRQFTNEHSDFYTNSGFTIDNVFDPRVIYDRYNDRFIHVAMDHKRDSSSCIYVSFSKNNTPSDSTKWNHYKLPIDSTHYLPGHVYWYDYINIAVNKTELYITSNVFEYFSSTGNSSFVGNALWRIEKQNGYDSLALVCKKNSDILRPNSTLKTFTLVPLSESLQSDGYDDGCMIIANQSNNGDKIFWYHLTGNISDTTTTITSHELTTTSYVRVPYASQPGGNGGDRINVGDCRVRSGFYQNGKLHAVYNRSNADWGEIVYTVVDTATNTENRHTWGIANKNYLYPSIASFSNDTISEDVMISFLRCGPTIYPQICVVNYESGWSSGSSIIKSGLDVINFREDLVSPWDSLERWGDYTTIQRRYNQKACWLVGSYAYGSNLNLGNETFGVNAWIAEVGDTDVGIEENSISLYTMYPNPVKSGGIVYFKSKTPQEIENIIIQDLTGKIILKTNLISNSEIRIPEISNGLYLLTIITKNNNYETIKILVD